MLPDIREIDQETLEDLYKFNIKTGGNILIIGPSGVGKTQMAQQVIKSLNKKEIYLNLTVKESPDLIGLPYRDGNVTKYALPQCFPLDGSESPKSVLLLDELDKAAPDLQNPLLELLQFRSLDSTKLNISSSIATANLPDEHAFSKAMSHALTNRCKVYKVGCAFEPWRAWAVDSGINNLVVGFLSRNQDYLLRPAPEGDATAYNHCSPRGWTSAAYDLDKSSEEDSVGMKALLVAGHVGESAAVKFQVWLEHYRHISPQIDLLVQEGVKPNTEEMTVDRVLVCALAAAGAVSSLCQETPQSKKAKEAHTKKLQKYVKNVFVWLNELPSEFSLAAVKNTFNSKILNDNELSDVEKFPEFLPVFIKIRKDQRKS